MPRATCRFYGPLNDLLPPERRQRNIDWRWDTPEPVREMIEGLGVPHVEVSLILVDGEPACWKHRLHDGDHVAVYPPFCALEADVPVSLRSGDEPVGRFVLDVHLGRLARWLRLLGLDTAYANWYDDETLARISQVERRILLTRDRRLLMRSIVEYGHWVRSQDPRAQLLEIIQHYDLLPLSRPYTRCAHCNGMLAPASREEIAPLLQPDTARYYDEFTRCTACGKVYWPGSHLRRVRMLMDGLRKDLGEQPGTSSSRADECAGAGCNARDQLGR
jgi:hypothetical protein